MPEIVAPISRTYAAGDDLSLQFTVTDADGAVVDITGYTCRFAIARRVGDTAVISTEASPATATVSIDGSSPATGIFTVTIDKANTSALVGTYYFESEIEDGATDETTVARGWTTFKATTI